MDIYFVRHGQTTGNVAHRHQADSTPLSQAGEQQAEAVATVIKELKPTHLISSHIIRAIETARPISEATGLEITIAHEFAELDRPRYLHGRKHFSLHSLFYYVLWFLSIENRKLAGESYLMIRQRVSMAKHFLRQYPSDARIVVVSHSVFINLFLSHMCRPTALPPHKATRFILSVLKIPNTKIVHVTYDEQEEGECKWKQQSEADSIALA